MKSILLIIYLWICVLFSVSAQTVVVPVPGGSGSLPPMFEVEELDEYIYSTKRFIKDFYYNLLFIVGHESSKEVYTSKKMAKGRNYMLEFRPVIKDTLQRFTAEQYMDELDRAFLNKGKNKLDFEVNNICIQDYEIKPHACFIIVHYQLTLKNGEEIIFMRKCRAHCLIENAWSHNVIMKQTEIIF